MSEVDGYDAAADRFRAEYEEFRLRDSTVAMVSDPENDRAWLQSTETVSVDP